MRSPPGKYALAEDDPKTPEEKREMGQREILANSGREHLDICYVRWLNTTYPSVACSDTHSAPHEGKRQSKPVRREPTLLGETLKRSPINEDDLRETATETARE